MAVALGGDVSNLKSDVNQLNCGNLLNDLAHSNLTNKGITWAWNGNKCTVSGTSTATANNDVYLSQSELPSGFEAGKTYHVYYSSGNVNLRIYVFPNEGTLTEILSTKIDADFTLPINTVGLIIRLNIPSGVTVNETIYPVISDDYSNQKIQRTLNDLQKSLVLTQNGASYLLGYSDFVNGTLSNGNLNRTVLYRVSSESIIKFDYNITLKVVSGFKFSVQTFSDGTYTSDSGWKTTEYTIPANTQFKILIARVSENTAEIADVSLFATQITLKTSSQTAIDNHNHYVSTHPYKCVTTISRELVERGSLDQNGEDSSYAGNARIRTALLFAVNDIYISANNRQLYPNAKVGVNYFDDTPEWISWSGWKSIYRIPKGSIFRALFAQDSTSFSEVSVDNIYNTFTVQPYNNFNNERVCKAVSHQGNYKLSDNHCKAEGYVMAGLAGFEYAECDVKFTADDVPVCNHDGGFNDATTGDWVRLESYTFSELQQFDYYGGTIASLDEVISICKKYNMGLYLDQLKDSWSTARYDAIFEVINKYRYLDHCKFLVVDITTAGIILARCKTAWIICGQPYGSQTPDSAIALADSVITDYNKVDVMLSHQLGVNVITNAVKSMDSRFGLAIYTLDTNELKEEFAPIATSLITNDDVFV